MRSLAVGIYMYIYNGSEVTWLTIRATSPSTTTAQRRQCKVKSFPSRPLGLEAKPRQWRQWRQHGYELWFTQALIGPAQLILARGMGAKGNPDLFFLAIAFRRSFSRDLLCLTPKGIGSRSSAEAWRGGGNRVWLPLLSLVVCLVGDLNGTLGGGLKL